MGSENDSKEPGKVRFILMTLIRLILVFAFFMGLLEKRYLVLSLSAVAFFLTFAPFILKRLFEVKTTVATDIVILLFVYGILFLGEVRGIFEGFWWWDILLTLIAAIALGFIGLSVMYALYNRDVIDASPLVIVALAFSFAFAIGALWEVFEFLLDSVFGFNFQKSGVDTMKDLIVNAIGAFLVSFGGYFHMKKSGKKGLISNFIVNIVERNPRIFGSGKKKEENHEKVKRLITEGEGNNIEFKSTLRTNLYTNEIDKNIEHATLKTVAAYLNTDGGTLLVGVSDKGEVHGVGKDNFPDNDKLSLHFTNLLKQHIGSEYLPYINHEIVPIEDKHVLKIECKKSDKHVFLKNGKSEEFYIRNGPSSAKLEGSALIDYINNKFK